MEYNLPLSPLGRKIFFDRYALKMIDKRQGTIGDTVVVITDKVTGQREIGTITRTETNHFGHMMFEVRLDGEDRPYWYDEELIEVTHEQPADMINRVANAVGKTMLEREAFKEIMNEWKFIPAGRILTAAGNPAPLTYYNCYVIPSPKDSRQGIMETLTTMTEIMSRGGGVGINISSLRPKKAVVRGVNGHSSGAVSWGGLYSYTTGLIEQGGSRRGALMLIMNDWHPDLLEFIEAKKDNTKIVNANISVGISDTFMHAVENDEIWVFSFPDTAHPNYDEEWDGDLHTWISKGYPFKTYGNMKAREVWRKIVESAWESAEPGIWFTSRSNQYSNSRAFSPLIATNPCGEQPLPAWGVCNLGSINLSKFVVNGYVDWIGLKRTVHIAVQFLDRVIDTTPYFFQENEDKQKAERRIGLNTMGLADMLIQLGIRYGSPECIKLIEELYQTIQIEAYQTSIELAEMYGSFPEFSIDKLSMSKYFQSLPVYLQEDIAAYGLRNVTLLTQAPNGTIGTMVGTSTGIEPFFSFKWMRKSRLGSHEEVLSLAQPYLDNGSPLPDYFVTAMDLSPIEHVTVQATIQKYVDSAISKTVNVPANYTVEQVDEIYRLMHQLGCKGGTIYRDQSRIEQVLIPVTDEEELCPVCKSKLTMESGCATCDSCGYSMCSL